MPSCDFNNFDNCTCLDCKREREIWSEKIEKQKELITNECNVETWKEREEKQKEEEELKRNDFLNKQNELFQEFSTKKFFVRPPNTSLKISYFKNLSIKNFLYYICILSFIYINKKKNLLI